MKLEVGGGPVSRPFVVTALHGLSREPGRFQNGLDDSRSVLWGNFNDTPAFL